MLRHQLPDFALLFLVTNNVRAPIKHTNVHPLHTRTEKDARNLCLKGPTGHTNKVPGYGGLLLFLVQTCSQMTENRVMLTTGTRSSVSKPTATLHCLCY